MESNEEIYDLNKIKLCNAKTDNLNIDIESVVNGNDIICLFLSAHWCNPCKRFFPTLLNAYNQWKDNKIKIEIIFCSSDSNEDAFKEYYSTMPWLANEYSNKELIEDLKTKFKLKGMPSLLVFNNKGKLIDKEAQEKLIVYKEKAVENWIS